MISVQTADFDLAAEYRLLAQGAVTGAVVTFVGRVRDFDGGNMLLQHYPGMTEKVLHSVVDQARKRWNLEQIRVIHRVGNLKPGDQIVLVGISSRHRSDAFAACEFIMDLLKTEAPFWKKEGSQWVEAAGVDSEAASRWYD